MGRVIADLVTGRKPDIDPDGFGIERYRAATRPQWQPRLANESGLRLRGAQAGAH